MPSATCADARRWLPECKLCIPGLYGADCTELSRATVDARADAKREAARRYGAKSTFEMYPYLSGPDLAGRQALAAQWMEASAPRRILDIGPYTSPMMRWLRHCPDEVIAVEPCGETATREPGRAAVSRWEACQVDPSRRVLFTVSPSTIKDFLALPHLPVFDAVVCIGCDQGFGPNGAHLKSFRALGHGYSLFLEHAPRYAPAARMARAVLALPGCVETARAELRVNVSTAERNSNERLLQRITCAPRAAAGLAAPHAAAGRARRARSGRGRARRETEPWRLQDEATRSGYRVMARQSELVAARHGLCFAGLNRKRFANGTSPLPASAPYALPDPATDRRP